MPTFSFSFLATALILFMPASAAVGQPALLAPQDAPLTARDGAQFTVTTARVVVPELRAARDAATVELAVVRIRRVGASPGRADVILAGGPGDSGVRMALDLVRQGGGMLREFADGDIVGIDQRGTGASTPSLRAAVSYNWPVDRAGSVAAWLPLAEQAGRQAAAQMRSRGIRLQAYNSEESADDVASVLGAFGYRQASLWGRSYGSHLALAVARRHPDLVERMVLASPEGPDDTWKLPSQVDRVLHRIAERAGRPDMPERLRAILRRLEQQAVRVTLREPGAEAARTIDIGPFDVQWVIAQVIGDPRALATLPAAVEQMDHGDFERVARLSLALRPRAGIDSAMKPAMDLASGASATRTALIGNEAKHALLGDAMNFPARYLGDAWAISPLGVACREPVRAAMPVLILAGDLDARTPLENARHIAAHMERAQLVVLENGAHQFDLFGDPALRAVLARFARGEPVQAARVVLPAIPFEKIMTTSAQRP